MVSYFPSVGQFSMKLRMATNHKDIVNLRPFKGKGSIQNPHANQVKKIPGINMNGDKLVISTLFPHWCKMSKL